MTKTKEEGSITAKRGFKNEKDVRDKFNNWKEDKEAKKWLLAMDYNLEEIEKVEAVKITGGYKTDVQIKVFVYLKDAIRTENLSIKLVSNKSGFNQIDKRWVDDYADLWDMPNDIRKLFKYYTGEKSPTKYKTNIENLKDSRRIYLNEMKEEDKNKIINFIKENKVMIIADIIKGRGKFSAEWMLVIQKVNSNYKWALKDINKAMNIFSEGGVRITNYGNPRIGKIGIQRKGGDNGRETANMLQFKCDPTKLIKSNNS